MKNKIVVYTGGYHGEFFVGNIVSNTDKFDYHYFKCRSESLNAYRYEAIQDSGKHATGWYEQSADDLDYWSTRHGKPIIARSHDFLAIRTLPVIRLHTECPIYHRRAILLKCIKGLDKTYSKMPLLRSYGFNILSKNMDHTTDRLIFVDIKEWLHNKNLEKIEDFFEIEYTQKMEDAVTEYFLRDEKLLDEYFYDWKNHTDNHLLEKMVEIDEKYAYFS